MVNEVSSKNKCVWDELTNQYSLSKTLRFELKPIGKTLEHIKKDKIISEDEERVRDFGKAKKIIDDFYKEFIDDVLNKIKIDKDDLENFRKIYEELKKDRTKNENNATNNKNKSIEEKTSKKKEKKPAEDLKKDYNNIQKSLRNKIYDKIISIYISEYGQLNKSNDQLENEDISEDDVDDDLNQNTDLEIKSQSRKKDKNNLNSLFKGALIKNILPNWLEKNDKTDDKKYIEKFNNWITYFNGFFENRKNVFSKEEIPTSIIYRIVHVNLPKYINNLANIEKISELSDFDLKEFYENYSLELENKNIKEYFSLDNFDSFLNQKGIEKYNLLIGGKSTTNTKIKGINEYVNLYSQKKSDKNIRKLKLTPLYKQILSDRDSFSDRFEQFKNNEEVVNKINSYYSNLQKNIITKLEKLINNIDQYDLSQIYIRNDSLNDISKDLFDDYNKIKQGLQEYAIKEKKLKDAKIEDFIKQKYVSIFEINKGLELLDENLDINNICNYFKSFKINDKDLIDEIKTNYKKFEKINDICNSTYFDNDANIEIIKSFLDSILGLLHFIKPIYVDFNNMSDNSKNNKKSEAYELDVRFYEEFDELYEIILEIVKIYNQTRNYVTQKPFSTKKFKLNFDKSTLLAGWDKNKEKDNYGVILKKGRDYYLGILKSDYKNVFDTLPISKNGDIEKMVYKLLPGPNRMLPKVFFSKKDINYYNPSEEILEIRNHSSHTKGGKPQKSYVKKDFNIMDCHKFIDFLKESIDKHPEWGVFNFKFKDATEYEDSSEFYFDVANQGYILDFVKYDFESIMDLVNSGKLYLFQIYNKDFSENKCEKNKNSKKNLHTMYWEELFSEDNLNDVVYKLNGNAEIFYRNKSIDKYKYITHPKNQEITNKNPINNKKESYFEYDLIKDKRYTEDKFLFHCPITLNFKQKDRSSINNKINELIKKNNDINVLSIDRGERNLLYYTLLNPKGEILEQGSFNWVSQDIERKNRKYDYWDKLDKLEGERDEARKNWKKIQNIKELKEGYLSQVIPKLAKLAIENNAIIVLEDLNFGFKTGRFKIEKQVYQKFEKMLIDKLNYLVFKDSGKNTPGGLLKAYQLTSMFKSFKDLGKQSGILFYVNANYTSKIDPKTGFVNLLYPKYINENQAKEFLKKFKYIKYNKSEGMFEFKFKYSNFKDSQNKLIKKIKYEWVIWSHGEKLYRFRNKDKNNQWDTKEINVTDELKNLFDENKINYENTDNLIGQITNSNSSEFLKSLLFYLKLILQLRNSNSKTGEDYILSCVKDKDGKFFDSRYAKDYEPENADANGAYHIGIKGLMVLEKIRNKKGSELAITRDEYINYVIDKNK